MVGMTEKEILDVCNEVRSHKGIRDWTVEFYGNGKWLRKYAYYPRLLPIFAHLEHGVNGTGSDSFLLEDLSYRMECNLFYGVKKAEKFTVEAKKRGMNKFAYSIQNMFPFCREQLHIEQDRDAHGTIAFPAHSTDKVKTTFSHQSYIEELKALPDFMQPFSVCLSQHDINDKVHEVYLANKIPVFTAGALDALKFPERFYDILRKFKYSTSNYIGSYAFFSVEIGIPFSLFGKNVYFDYINSEHHEPGIADPEKKLSWYSQAKVLFEGIHREVTPQQRAYVMDALCLRDGDSISRKFAAYLLYKAYFKRRFGKLGKLFGMK